MTQENNGPVIRQNEDGSITASIVCDPIVLPGSIEKLDVGQVHIDRHLTEREVRAIIREEIAAAQGEQLKQLRMQREKDNRRARRNSDLRDIDPGPVCQPMPDGSIKMYR